MINYISLREKQYPASFSNAAFMRYEDSTGRSAFADFLEALAIDANGVPNLAKVKIGFFAKMTYFACIAGANIARQPFDLILDEVAESVTMDNLPIIITFISDALPRQTEDAGEAMGTTPQ